MNRHVVLYPEETSGTLAERFPSRAMRCEVWRGLPNYGFQPALGSKGRSGLRAEGPGFYVWVPPQAARIIEDNPNVLLVVHGYRIKDRTEIFSVEALPKGTRLSAAIEMVERVNNPPPKRSWRGGRRTSPAITPKRDTVHGRNYLVEGSVTPEGRNGVRPHYRHYFQGRRHSSH